MKPNLFKFATKELSQDAFITWLLTYADEANKQHNPLLCACGQAFVTQLIKKQIPDFNEKVTSVKAKRQWENIDVKAIINNKYMIIIEDKTQSSHHSDQLNKYKEKAKNYCSEHNLHGPICIYLKTGNESNKRLEVVKKYDYKVFDRKDLIKVLSENRVISNNDILIDFYHHLMDLDQSYSDYDKKDLQNWKGPDWEGFFMYLDSKNLLVDWFYVNNPSGGFWGAILTWETFEGFPVFLQIEQNKLCFKISTDPDKVGNLDANSKKQKVRSFTDAVLTEAKAHGFNHIRRPGRIRSGDYTTVAIVDSEHWLGKSNQTINMDHTIEKLKKYVEFLNNLVQHHDRSN